MRTAAQGDPEAKLALAVARIGALPDAPLAMPKQRLDRPALSARSILAALLRPLLARTRRSEG
jgi:hypothetical protein